MTDATWWIHSIGYGLCVAGAAYACGAAFALERFQPRKPAPAGAATRAVSVLKPLCGAEPRLLSNLDTFCRQTHPDYEIVFGVRSPVDPAIAVVETLRAMHPSRDITLVVDPSVHGSNPKVSNLINIASHARHDWLVLADSDISVDPDYLVDVCAPLADPCVGVVTCLYHARSASGFWARMGGEFIDGWFAPSVRVSAAMGSRNFGFGATLALRRDTLSAIGGFEALRNRLADDFWLAEYARRQGLHTVLSSVVVHTDVTEQRFAHLWQREIRWLRTIRTLNPVGFAFVFVTFSWPLIALGACLSHATPGFAIAGIGAAARLVSRWRTRARGDAGPPRLLDLALGPIRDLLLAAQWIAAFTGDHVLWRNTSLSLHDKAVDTSHPNAFE
ncbi:bacteriohopanetetrol glucosamine biosynthesis glycosyltransferase HpnI [Pararobbsia silviterrae]|uniref:Glycosyltransferase n=1 Tax=Pararobbsia silviterrae TaxID=1792498 RepID=A0A494XM89_9BURK|nr:bacteriohopanetetrol glucosamine biosynthesis glycosyltransferase HpnI [Pararobbsia silviterrae]RKP51815.1 glycosyltransferase [Pararobbsia silviterrae]